MTPIQQLLAPKRIFELNPSKQKTNEEKWESWTHEDVFKARVVGGEKRQGEASSALLHGQGRHVTEAVSEAPI